MERVIELVPIEKLRAFPGNPKDLSDVDRTKLLNQIRTHGILKALSVWKKGKTYVVLDGNQRLDVLNTLYQMPYGAEYGHIPCEIVECKDEQDAAAKCLALVGQFGRINKAKLKKFVTKAGYGSLEDAQQVLSFVELDLEEGGGGGDEGNDEGNDPQEPNTEPWERVAHVECPSCSVQFPQKKHRCKPEKGKLWKEEA